MPECSVYQENLSAFIDGELSAEERESLEAHLRGCASCRNALSLLQAMQGALQEELVQPPERLAEGIRYKIQLEASRKRARLRNWSFTAIAAVICLALLGAVRFAPQFRGGRAQGAPMSQAKMLAAPAMLSPESVTADSAGEAAFDSGSAPEEADSTETNGCNVFSEDMSDGDMDALSPTVRGESEPGSAPSPALTPKLYAYSASELPGYNAYKSMKEEGRYYSICIVYHALPEGISEESGCILLEAAEGRESWRIPLSLCEELERQERFDEIYYDNLMAGESMVIVIQADE